MCRSTSGSCSVTPSACPAGRIVTFATGSVCSDKAATRAWPDSCTATACFSSGSSTFEPSLRPRMILSRAASKSAAVTTFLWPRTAKMAASFTRLARSAPEKPGGARARACAALADRVDLVDEDDRGCPLARLGEQVTDPRRADADEQLHEAGACDREEGDARLAGHGAREQGLACSWRTDHENAARDNGPGQRVAVGFAQEVDDLADLGLRAFVPGDVVERGGGTLFVEHLGAGPADAE